MSLAVRGGVGCIIDDEHPESLGLKPGDDTRQDQVFPTLDSHGNAIFRPSFYPIRVAVGDEIIVMATLQRADLLTIDGSAIFATIGQGSVGGKTGHARGGYHVTISVYDE